MIHCLYSLIRHLKNTHPFIIYLYIYFLYSYNRNRSNACITSFTTTLDMRKKDVIYGSKVGNTTNPQFLEVDSWVTSYFMFVFIFTQFDNTFVLSIRVQHDGKKIKIINFR